MSQPSPAKEGICRTIVWLTRFLDATARIGHFANFAFCAVVTFCSTRGAALQSPHYDIDMPPSVAAKVGLLLRQIMLNHKNVF